MYRSCDLHGYMCIGNVILWIHVFRSCDLMDTCV